MAHGQRQANTRWQRAGEWRVEAVFPTGSTPAWGNRSCRHQRRGRRLPDPGSYTGTRHHSANGYRDPLPRVSIAQRRPCSPPSACPVRGVRGSYATPVPYQEDGWQRQEGEHPEHDERILIRRNASLLAQLIPQDSQRFRPPVLHAGFGQGGADGVGGVLDDQALHLVLFAKSNHVGRCPALDEHTPHGNAKGAPKSTMNAIEP
jgi:hypothetical protein